MTFQKKRRQSWSVLWRLFCCRFARWTLKTAWPSAWDTRRWPWEGEPENAAGRGQESHAGRTAIRLMWTFCLHEVKRTFICSLRQEKSMWTKCLISSVTKPPELSFWELRFFCNTSPPPLRKNQVPLPGTWFYRNASRSLKIRLPRGQPDSTRNGFSGSKWPAEKAGQVGGQGFANLWPPACQNQRAKMARWRESRGNALPSDMMLCVISYWVLSGAKRRQIQQLRCCVFPRQAKEMFIVTIDGIFLLFKNILK